MSLEIIGNRYQLLSELGQGGMGVVYRAHDRLTGDIVAIKRVNTPQMQGQHSQTSAAEFWLGLAQEFRLLSTIRHPNIISVIDYGFDQKQNPYYVMELLTQAQTITSYAQDKPLVTRIHLLIQMLQAIAFLHRRGILHRDIKPDNILVVGDQIKVLDFGLAVAHTHYEEEQDAIVGTIAYMPPEVLMGKGFSTATDLYAVGVIAYEVLSGVYPFSIGDMNALLQDIITNPPDLSRLEGSDGLKTVIDCLLSKEPENRYQDAEKVIQALVVGSDLDIVYETSATRESFLQSARFVGRTQEIGLLTEALRNTQQNSGSLWMVGGESGVGKSRLMEELRTLALVGRVLVLRGQAIVEGGAVYLLWRTVLRSLCLKVTMSDLEASVIKAIVPDISALIERPVADAPVLDPDAEQTRLLNTIEALFRRHTDPTLIIMEDLQWARESLSVITRLAKVIGTLPLMIVGTYRDDERPELAAQFPEARSLPLKRLSKNEIADLSESILGSTVGRRDSVIDLLRTETEGNAFFIVEIVRALAEKAGHLSQVGMKTLPSNVFAGGIRAAIQQRLARVPREAYIALEWVAVAGREIDLKFLAHLLPSLQIDQWLLDCNSVLEVQDNIWRFAHDKLREAVLENMSEPQLMQRHARIAEALEQFHPNDPAYYVRLAYHWREARQPLNESRFNILAGKEALALGNYHEAIDFLQRSLRYYENSHADPKQKAVVTKQIGDAYFGLGQLNDAYQSLSQALAPLSHRSPSNAIMLYGRIGVNVFLQARHRLLPTRIPREADAEYLRNAANACLQLAVIHYFKNEKYHALYYSMRGTNLALQAGPAHRDELSRLQATFAMMLSLIPLHSLARTYYGLAKANVPNNNDIGLRGWVLMMSGLYATNTAEWHIAEPNLIQCLALAEEAGNVRRTQEALLSLAAVYFFKGEWGKSYDLAEKILASGLTYNNLQCQAWGLDDLGRVLYHYGDHEKALEHFSQSRQIYERIGDTSGLIWVYGALAQVYTRRGDLEAARPHAEKVKGWLINTQPGTYGLLEGYQGLADFCLTQYEQQRTLAARQEAEVAVMLMHRFGRIFSTGKAYRYVYEGWLAGLNGETSKALRLHRYAVQEAQKYTLLYEEGLASLHTGRLLPADHPQRGVLLEQAAQRFHDLGAAWDEARAREPATSAHAG